MITDQNILQRIKDLRELLPEGDSEDIRTSIIQLRNLMPKTDKILRIDADSLLYMVAYSPSYKPVDAIDGGTFVAEDTVKTRFKDYKLHLKALIAEVVQSCEVESYLGNMVRFCDYELIFTPSTNFRYDIFPDYKKSRLDKPQTIMLKRLKRYAKKYLGYVVEGVEADDVVYYYGIRGHPVATGDKDVYNSIPGGVYWYHSMHKKVMTNTKEEANRFVLMQTLAGDSSDDIPGIKGIGMKNKLLDGIDNPTFDDAVKIYENHIICYKCWDEPKGRATTYDKIDDLEHDGDLFGTCPKCESKRMFYQYTKEDAILTRRLVGLDQWNKRRGVRLWKI